MRRATGRRKGFEVWREGARGSREGSGFGPRKRDHRSADRRHDGEDDRRRHAHSAQWLPPAEAPSRLGRLSNNKTPRPVLLFVATPAHAVNQGWITRRKRDR